MSVEGEFEAFVLNVEPDLRRALSGHMKEESIGDAVHVGIDADCRNTETETQDEIRSLATDAGEGE